MYRHELEEHFIYTAGIGKGVFIESFEVRQNHIAATYHQAVVITAVGDSSTQRGGGIGKSLVGKM